MGSLRTKPVTHFSVDGASSRAAFGCWAYDVRDSRSDVTELLGLYLSPVDGYYYLPQLRDVLGVAV